MDVSREVFWDIGAWGNVVYGLAAIALGILSWAVYRRYRLWRLGKPDNRLDPLGPRVKSFLDKALWEGFGHKKLFRQRFSGIMHLLIFWGAAVFALAAALDFISHYIVDFLHGGVYVGVSLASDSLGILALVGVAALAGYRYLKKPARLDNQVQDAVALSLVFIIIFTGFVVEGVRMAAEKPEFAAWTPGGWLLSRPFWDMGEGARLALYKSVWSFHLALVFGAVVWVALAVPKLVHIAVAPTNVFFRSLKPRGQLTPIDFQATQSFGASKLEDLTWKQLLDLDACTRCGRCQDNCPAHLSGKVLSPKVVTQDLRACLESKQPSSFIKLAVAANPESGNGSGKALIGGVVSAEALWDCTTCAACMEQCPVYVEHVDKFIEMRRNQVLTGAKLPDTVQATLRNMELRGHPWRGAEHLRDDWAKGLDIKRLTEGTQSEWLYWVGCTGAFMDRNIKVTQAVAKVLKAAGVDFAILGAEEACCGDPARRIGNELQFQMMALPNIELMKSRGVKKIVTHCPHCYQSLKHEYPQFGGQFEVYHHTELLSQLIAGKKLHLSTAVDKLVTFHDPCYLGRYNNIYDAPRRLLKAVPGLKVAEMERRRDRSFCCGGGGGHAWMDEKVGKRINQMRVQQAIDVKAELMALACPYCLQMLDDGIKSLESKIQLIDVAELVAQALEPTAKKDSAQLQKSA